MAIWHGAGANPGVLSQKPSTENDQFCVAVLRLEWVNVLQAGVDHHANTTLLPDLVECTRGSVGQKQLPS